VRLSEQPPCPCRLCGSVDHRTAQCPDILPFYRDVGKHRLLTREETIRAIQEIERMELDLWTRALKLRPKWPGYEGLSPEQARTRDIDRTEIRKVVTDIDRRALSRALRETDRARNAFLSANMRLVIRISTCFLGMGLPLQDLIQEGSLGLMRGLARFEWRRGFTFSTYASWWVRHGIYRALADKRANVRIPVHAQSTRAKFRKVMGQMANRLGRDVEPEEVAAEMGLTKKAAQQVQEPCYSVSINAPLPGMREGDVVRTWEDTMPDEGPTPHDRAETEQREKKARALLDRLSPVQRLIVSSRFGFGRHAMNLREIGDELGLSRERVRQIEVEALRKLRNAAEELR
jgi:RNA polymerase primary sigma factor